MDLAAMRGLVRRDLKDEDAASYRWTDNEIDRAIARALAELSRSSPREMKSAVATVGGSREIDIAGLADRISVDRVEFPAGEHPRLFQRFSVYGDKLTLTGDCEGDGRDCYIYWSALHTLGAGSTVPAHLEDILALGAAAYAGLSQSQYHTDRANAGGEDVGRDYAAWGRERLREFREALRRTASSRRLKPGSLYAG